MANNIMLTLREHLDSPTPRVELIHTPLARPPRSLGYVSHAQLRRISQLLNGGDELAAELSEIFGLAAERLEDALHQRQSDYIDALGDVKRALDSE